MKSATIRPQMPINMKKEENSNPISQRKATKAESIIGKNLWNRTHKRENCGE